MIKATMLLFEFGTKSISKQASEEFDNVMTSSYAGETFAYN